MKLLIELDVDDTPDPGRAEHIVRDMVELADALRDLAQTYPLNTGGEQIRSMRVLSRFETFAGVNVSFGPEAVRTYAQIDTDAPFVGEGDDAPSLLEAANLLDDEELFMAAVDHVGRDELLGALHGDVCRAIINEAWRRREQA